ncbi:hypothetical protein [Mobiluncus mulieris]|uniref:hypothetical protein n=1 Tax=Mobiluncus mulieris TaxID=2052 RepID=UPI00146FC9F5|nr:hypothetical protein [Mobiluncus mulieris]
MTPLIGGRRALSACGSFSVVFMRRRSELRGKICMTILSYSLRYNSFVVIVHPRVG